MPDTHKRKAHIVFCIDQFIMGGVEKIAMVLLPELSKYYDVTVLSFKKVTDSFFLKFFAEENITLKCIKAEKPKNFLKRLWRSLIGKRISKIRCGKIFKTANLIVDYKNFCWAEYIKKFSVPKITFFHGSFPLFNKNNRLKSLKIYDKFVCLSDSFRQDFIHTFPDLQNKIEHIYNPINEKEIKEKSKHVFVRVKKPYFVAVQRLDVEMLLIFFVPKIKICIYTLWAMARIEKN